MISAIVLAAGESKRMKGSNKLLLPLANKTVIEHVVDTIALSKVGEIIVVSGHQADLVQKVLQNRSAKIIKNTNFHTGMTSSIQTGVHAVSSNSRGILLFLSDLVFIESSELNDLVDVFDSSLWQDRKVIISPSFQGQSGHPVIFSAYYRSHLLQHQEPEGCWGIIQQNMDHLRQVPMDTDHVLQDIDTETDYQKAVQQFNTRQKKCLLQAKADFPILQRKINGKPLIYLDNAATTQKPKQVLESLISFYEQHNSNVHRGIYKLSEEATSLYEGARHKVAKFIGAPSSQSVVFTRGTTESINLTAFSWLKPRLKKGDRILVTEMEHHSNLVPWQMVARETGAQLHYLPITKQGTLDLESLDALLAPNTSILAVSAVSNVLGTVNPIRRLVELAHRHNIPVLVDGAQAVARQKVDVETLGCDFFAFSAHKMYGPTGIGVLYCKPQYQQEMQPFMGGGGMIEEVLEQESSWAEYPWKLEAGTPPVDEAVGLSAAIDYLQEMGLELIWAHEQDLTDYALQKLTQIPGLQVHGPLGTAERAGVISFQIGTIHPHDVAQVLDDDGIAVRAGHHCAQILMNRLGVHATVRVSFSLYNDYSDIDLLAESLTKALQLFE
ncbi:MAG: SufS family cysteine desulfurase [SAR324 cluster bacterium]|nr:SufS family cysteine desulfurase [SAR324 cluster bacterium]